MTITYGITHGLAPLVRGEDVKGTRWMPWHRKPTKDAASCDNPRGGAHTLRSAGLRMGEPERGNARSPVPERDRGREATRGTETSKYPEEEKSTEIAPVAASERATAQTHASGQAGGRCRMGVVGPPHRWAPARRRSHKARGKRNGMGRPAAAGESPVRGSPAPAMAAPE